MKKFAAGIFWCRAVFPGCAERVHR